MLPANDTPRRAGRQSAHLFAYRMALAPDPPSLRPETFWPSDVDELAAMAGPEERMERRLHHVGTRLAAAVIALVSVVLLVLCV